ncbi:hypothetical protein [Aliiroseovarius sp.]|uniref:hypothetical protein n=1 Tax=Aliiroseovarius sp. TaxID=1872442 RepID=UPI003BA850DF
MASRIFLWLALMAAIVTAILAVIGYAAGKEEGEWAPVLWGLVGLVWVAPGLLVTLVFLAIGLVLKPRPPNSPTFHPEDVENAAAPPRIPPIAPDTNPGQDDT